MTPTPFHHQLKAARIAAGLAQHAAAKRLGISTSTFQRWESGTGNPTQCEQAGALAILAGNPCAPASDTTEKVVALLEEARRLIGAELEWIARHDAQFFTNAERTDRAPEES